MTEATRKRGDYRRHMTEEHAASAAVVPFSTQVEATPVRAFPSPELTSSWGKAQRIRHKVKCRRRHSEDVCHQGKINP